MTAETMDGYEAAFRRGGHHTLVAANGAITSLGSRQEMLEFLMRLEDAIGEWRNGTLDACSPEDVCRAVLRTVYALGEVAHRPPEGLIP